MDLARRADPLTVEPSSVPARPLRRPFLGLLAGLALVVTACTSGSTPDAAPEPPPFDGPVDTSPRDVSLTVDGRERNYLLQPALGLPEGERAALVVVLHQEGGTPAGVATETALQDLRSRGATLAYPAGVDQSWDAGKCCGTSQDQGIDDVAFLDAVVEDVAEQAPIDPERTAMVGYSSGGMLTYNYVCSRPGRLAAAVVVSGSLETDCDADITTPDVLAVHGKLDGTIGLSEPRFIKALGLAPRPAESSLAVLTASAGCDSQPATDEQPGVEVRRWVGCNGGSVQAAFVPGKGHGWKTLDASRRTLEFLGDRLLDR